MKIVLATLHSRYVHNSLALPCLAAALQGMEGIFTVIREFTVNEPADRVLAELIAAEADVAAFSGYIWNVEETLRIASDLKAVRPETLIVLGGPEVSFDTDELMTRHPAIDCVVRGEGEMTFRELVAELSGKSREEALSRVSAGISFRKGEEVVAASDRPPIDDLDSIPSPFAAGFADITKPLVYYETSRGCPFSCAFCLSSLDREVRSFSMERIRKDLGMLMAKEAQNVKLVDRTFNYSAVRANEIWEFILKENRTSSFHFEIAADLLTEENFRLLRKVPSGMFRFEIGVQSGKEETLARVGRKTALTRLYANVERLRRETGVLVHLDLVAGLPGEDFRGFLGSLQQLFNLCADDGRRPAVSCHIQVELLKVLKGSPMRRIAEEEHYVFSASPPYRILRTLWLSYADIRRIDSISRLVDLYFNSGRFATALAQIAAAGQTLSSFFAAIAEYWEKREMPASLAQPALFEALWRFAEHYLPEDEFDQFREALCYDYCLVEYPSGRSLPLFFTGAVNTLAKVERDEIVGKLDVTPESRVRTFSMAFRRDYRSTSWREGAVELLFVYMSAPGKGLRVKIIAV